MRITYCVGKRIWHEVNSFSKHQLRVDFNQGRAVHFVAQFNNGAAHGHSSTVRSYIKKIKVRYLNTFRVLRTYWKESVDFKEKGNGWLPLTRWISFKWIAITTATIISSFKFVLISEVHINILCTALFAWTKNDYFELIGQGYSVRMTANQTT